MSQSWMPTPAAAVRSPPGRHPWILWNDPVTGQFFVIVPDGTYSPWAWMPGRPATCTRMSMYRSAECQRYGVPEPDVAACIAPVMSSAQWIS
jgi:hypothetical protein